MIPLLRKIILQTPFYSLIQGRNYISGFQNVRKHEKNDEELTNFIELSLLILLFQIQIIKSSFLWIS